MNVLLLGQQEEPGELETHVRQLGLSLKQAGHRVAFAARDDSRLARDCRRCGLSVHRVRMGGGFDGRTYLQLARLARRDDVDLLHGHGRLGSIYSGLVARLTGRVGIATAHALGERPAAAPNHAVLTVSCAVRDSLSKRGVPAKKISVVYKGIPAVPRPTTEQRRLARSRLGLRDDDVAIAVSPCTGSRRERSLFAAAAAALKWRLDRVRFFLTAPGGADLPGESLRGQADPCGSRGKVGFLEGSRVPPSMLGAMDIYTQLGEREDLPLGVLRAFSAGLAVVALRAGGITEAVRHNETGLICGRGDRKMLVALLGLLVEDRGLRASLGAKARRAQRERFTDWAMALETERAYRSALDAASSRKLASFG